MKPVWRRIWAKEYRPLNVAPISVEAGTPMDPFSKEFPELTLAQLHYSGLT